jgi:hypothetical protein
MFISEKSVTISNIRFLRKYPPSGRGGPDRMVYVVEFTTTCAISAYHH